MSQLFFFYGNLFDVYKETQGLLLHTQCTKLPLLQGLGKEDRDKFMGVFDVVVKFDKNMILGEDGDKNIKRKRWKLYV